MSIQSANTRYYAGELTAGVFISDKEKVLKDLLGGRIATLSGPKCPAKNDMKFIENVILPPFLDLYQKFPEGYKLLMQKKLYIGIIEYSSSEFDPKKHNNKNDDASRIAATTLSKRPETGFMLINKYDRDEKIFGDEYLREAIRHEIMHNIDNFAVDDTKYASKMPTNLSDILEQEYNKKLSRMAKDYMERLIAARQELYDWETQNPKATEKEKMGKYIEIMNLRRCWAARRMAFAPDETLE